MLLRSRRVGKARGCSQRLLEGRRRIDSQKSLSSELQFTKHGVYVHARCGPLVCPEGISSVRWADFMDRLLGPTIIY